MITDIIPPIIESIIICFGLSLKFLDMAAGINNSPVAGQTVPHAHIHVIPRYEGDVDNPRGGVRNIIPGKGDY